MSKFTTFMQSMTNRLVLLTAVIFFARIAIFGDDYSGLELFNWQTENFKSWQLLLRAGHSAMS